MSIILFIVVSFFCMLVQGYLYRKWDRKILKYLPLLVTSSGFIVSLIIYLISYYGNIQRGLFANGTFAIFFAMFFGIAMGGCIVGIFCKRSCIFYVPFTLAVIFYGTVIVLGGIRELHPAVYVVLFFMFTSSTLMNRGKWQGCFIYATIGFLLIYMGMQETGQIMKEWPFGIVLLVYSGISGYLSYRKGT